MTYALPSDVQERMARPLLEAELELAEVLLRDVEVVIKARMPDLEERIASNKLSVDVLIHVECSVVKRVLQNAEGFIQETDGNYSYTRDRSIASGQLQLSAYEWALLGGGGLAVLIPEWEDSNIPFAPFGSLNAQWFGPPSWQHFVNPI